jgi:hypothetical protein
MYECSKCNGLYDLSSENIKLICNEEPTEHIIRCPHCKNETIVIGADVDYDMYGKPDKPAYLIFSRDRKQSDNLPIVEGSVHTKKRE